MHQRYYQAFGYLLTTNFIPASNYHLLKDNINILKPCLFLSVYVYIQRENDPHEQLPGYNVYISHYVEAFLQRDTLHLYLERLGMILLLSLIFLVKFTTPWEPFLSNTDLISLRGLLCTLSLSVCESVISRHFE